MKKVKFILIVAAFLLLNFDSAFGCVCVPTTPAQQIQQSKTIFSGKVMGRTATTIRFKVQKWWKGTRYHEVSIFADSKIITDCDVTFQDGETYLIYAYRSVENRLETNQCTGTKQLASADEDLKILGKGKMPNRKTPVTKKRRSR